MFQRFEQEMEKLGLLNAEKKIVLAVSGGVDSMVLLALMLEIPKRNRPSLSVAHINHALRPESDTEAAFVKEFVNGHHLPFYMHQWAKEDQPNSGIEEAARLMRYNFFKEVMDQSQSEILMTAHHQDDQVETILMKLTRGSSLQQLTGIKSVQPFHQGLLIRPLLPFSKEEIYRYAYENQVPYAEDETNHELTYSRNRFRNQIIPLLKEENDQFNTHVEQFADDLSDLLSIADGQIKKDYQELVTIKPNKIEFQLKPFYNYSTAMQRSLLIKILNEIYKESPKMYKTSYIEILQNWLEKTEGNSELHLSNDIRVVKSYDTISFQQQPSTGNTSTTGNHPESYTLDERPQRIQLSPTESITLKMNESPALKLPASSRPDTEDWLLFHPKEVEFPLTIRHRRPGDRMTYEGLTGTKKIKDIFIDEKVPSSKRDEAWIVEDAKGTIIWLVSFRKMDLLSDKETDKLTYVLKYKNHKSSEEYKNDYGSKH